MAKVIKWVIFAILMIDFISGNDNLSHKKAKTPWEIAKDKLIHYSTARAKRMHKK